MGTFINWVNNNPSGLLSISTAMLSAAVAIIVVMFTQLAQSRRQRKELLTTKLEELYLLLNQAASENIDRYESVLRLIDKTADPQKDDPAYNRQVYSLDLNKKVIMYIRLYFPKLSKSHQELFRHNRKINEIFYTLSSGGDTSDEELKEAFLGFGNCLQNMEQEIIDNKPQLVRDIWLPKKYKSIHLQ